MAEYELWLTDDAGRRIALLSDLTEPFFFSYTRSTAGLGTFNFGASFRELAKKVNPYFLPDRRVEVWRSAAHGTPKRREDVFMLRKVHVYTRENGIEVVQFYGRNGIDLLNRQWVVQRTGTSTTQKTDNIDDMMKAIVREQMLYGSAINRFGNQDNSSAYPQNEFSVQADSGLGPSVTRAFAGRKVFDILKELKEASQQLNVDALTNRRIYFDVVPRALAGITTTTNSPLGWEFQTFADLRGSDRTGGIVFSLENENISQPAYSISHLEEINSVVVTGNGNGINQLLGFAQDLPRVVASRWNRCEKVHSATSEKDTTALDDAGRAEVYKGRPAEELFVTLLNTPGGPNVPRSLYGLDWDLGDLVRVHYARKDFEAEIGVVYVAVDDTGKETITGRNNIQ